MNTYRFVIAVDINGDSLQDAYGKLHSAMEAAADDAEGYWEGFESTDEAYGPDNDGQIDPQDLQEARMQHWESIDEA